MLLVAFTVHPLRAGGQVRVIHIWEYSGCRKSVIADEANETAVAGVAAAADGVTPLPSIPAPSVKWCIVRHPVWSSARAQLHCCPYLPSEVSTYHSLLRDPLSPLWLLPKGFNIIIAYFRWAQGGPDWNTILAGSPCRDGKVNQAAATTTIQSCSIKLFHHHGHCLFQSTRHYHQPKLLHQAVPPPWPLLATKPSVTPWQISTCRQACDSDVCQTSLWSCRAQGCPSLLFFSGS